jgi:protein TonB
MERKKTPEADLENRRGLFFLTGLAVALSLFYVALEWKTPDRRLGIADELLAPLVIEEEFIADVAPASAEPVVEPDPNEKTVYEDFNVTDTVSLVAEEEALDPDELEVAGLDKKHTADDLIAETETEIIEEAVEEAGIMPQFPGGRTALARFLSKTVRYPSAAIKQKIGGRVWCSFVVERDGSISNLRVEEGVYAFLDDEALRALRQMPSWIPGEENGQKLRVKVYLPVVFRL